MAHCLAACTPNFRAQNLSQFRKTPSRAAYGLPRRLPSAAVQVQASVLVHARSPRTRKRTAVVGSALTSKNFLPRSTSSVTSNGSSLSAALCDPVMAQPASWAMTIPACSCVVVELLGRDGATYADVPRPDCHEWVIMQEIPEKESPWPDFPIRVDGPLGD
jgi:hypothetical protein